MKLNQFISNLLDIVNENIEYGELEVIHSSDDEGNAHYRVDNEPTLVIIENNGNHQVDIFIDEIKTHDTPNAIIIN